jgi:hypothetical protein
VSGTDTQLSNFSAAYVGSTPALAAYTGSSFTGSISGTTLNVTAIANGVIFPGQVISGTGVGSGSTTSLTNALSTTSGSAVVSVTQTSHGLTTGNSVTITGATAVGGLTNGNLSGTFSVTVTGVNTYTFTTNGSVTATSTVSNAGGTIQVVIPATEVISYGSGSGGTGTYTVNRTQTVSSTTITGSQGAIAITPNPGDNSQNIATTAFVQNALTVTGGGSVTTINTGTGLTGGPITTAGTISIATTGVSAGTYTYPASISVNAQGQITSMTAGSGAAGVTQVNTSGSVNGLTLTGGPITTTGTIVLGGTLSGVSLTSAVSGILPVANGGTGSSSGVSLTSGVTGVLPVANGGIGASSFSSAGLPTLSGANAFSSTAGNGFGGSNPFSNQVTLYSQTSTTAGNAIGAYAAGSTENAIACIIANSNSNYAVFGFGTPSSYSGAGAIAYVSSTSVNYATSSDRRLKTAIAPLTNSGAFIDSIQPRTFTWVGSGQADTGFIADELQQITPNAVTGQPNAVDEDGKPVYQMLDASTPEMIANIIAELQSLRIRVAALEAK